MKKMKLLTCVGILMLCTNIYSFAVEEISKEEYIKIFLDQRGEMEYAMEFFIPGPYEDISNSLDRDRMVNYFYYTYLMEEMSMEKSFFEPDTQFSSSEIKRIEGEYGSMAGDYDATGDEENSESVLVGEDYVRSVYPISDRSFVVNMEKEKSLHINDIKVESEGCMVDGVYEVSDLRYIVMLEEGKEGSFKFSIFDEKYNLDMFEGTVYGAEIVSVTVMDADRILLEFDKEISPEGLASDNFMFDNLDLPDGVSYLKVGGNLQRKYLILEKNLSTGVHSLMVSGVIDDYGNVNISSGKNRNISVPVREINDKLPPELSGVIMLDENHIKLEFNDLSSLSNDVLNKENYLIADEDGKTIEVVEAVLEPNQMGVENTIIIEIKGTGKSLNLAMYEFVDSFGNKTGGEKVVIPSAYKVSKKKLVSARSYGMNKVGLNFNGIVDGDLLDVDNITISPSLNVLRLEKNDIDDDEIIMYVTNSVEGENYKISIQSGAEQRTYSGSTYLNYRGEKDRGLILESVMRTDIDDKSFIDVTFSHDVENSTALGRYDYYIENVGFAKEITRLSNDTYRAEFDELSINNVYELRVTNVDSKDGKSINEDYNRIIIQ